MLNKSDYPNTFIERADKETWYFSAERNCWKRATTEFNLLYSLSDYDVIASKRRCLLYRG